MISDQHTPFAALYLKVFRIEIWKTRSAAGHTAFTTFQHDNNSSDNSDSNTSKPETALVTGLAGANDRFRDR